MKEEVVLECLEKGLDLVNRLAVPQLEHVPVFGTIASTLSKIILNTVIDEANQEMINLRKGSVG